VNQLKIFTLGALRVRVDGRSLDLGTPKQRALLALLVINRRRTVTPDRIIIALWGPDAPPQRRKDVWVYISRLRKSLGPAADALRREPGGHVLDIDDAVVDSVAFEVLVEEARILLPDDPAAASLILGEAPAAWSGSAYEEFVTNDFAAARRNGTKEAFEFDST
jgi:two-component SAPR family response regulator